ncbi:MULTISPECIES: hypothetical protein [unclassified Mesorhizobium]|uniref:hypothetical protein n=1 Tax=unclassified Mesorhizobium TaxID=325217 RepID=UPI001CCF9AAB|nr:MULTISPECIES: hypothetical protein [unclassified Mesorhizobium]MBZ9701733.1 hypothetical protein [Mesorhizobium sp. CO1-1-3]MBZ9949081.1 hypothetical protein [Mesorhizobium sp. BR1-1-11]
MDRISRPEIIESTFSSKARPFRRWCLPFQRDCPADYQDSQAGAVIPSFYARLRSRP